MKKIDELYAIILPGRTDVQWSVNKVIGIKYENGDLSFDELEISVILPPLGEVFTYQTFKGANEQLLKAGNLVIIPVKGFKTVQDNEKPIEVEHYPIAKLNGFEVIEMPIEFYNRDFVHLDEINNKLQGKKYRFELTDIYISIFDKLFGPFKHNKNQIEPKIGKEVSVFKYDPESVMNYQGDSYLLSRPKNQLTTVDCMSSTQLLEWLKSKLKNFGQYNGDINQIISLVKKTEPSDEGLDRTRFSRAMVILENIRLSVNDIDVLFSQTSTWHKIFQDCFLENQEEFKARHLANLGAEFSQIIANQTNQAATLDKAIAQKQLELEEYASHMGILQAQLEQSKKEIEFMEEKKEELILNLRIQAQIGPQSSAMAATKSVPVQNYEMKFYLHPKQQYFSDIDDYLDALQSLGYMSGMRKLFETGLAQLHQYKFIISNNIRFTLALIKSLGNAAICLQQAEIDWIKFSHLFSRGLEETIEAALTKPSQSHYFILQDFNLPSFECYGKPLLDLADSIREQVPGKMTRWPSNLWVIIVPVSGMDADLGFKINPETFKNWGVLPYTTENKFVSNQSLAAAVNLEAFSTSFDLSLKGDIEDYVN